MDKTLLIYARICPTESLHTQPIFDALTQLPNIDGLVLDGHQPYDIVKEQARIHQYRNVILLYTINWFNLPWNLTRYMAEVWRTFPFNLENINFYKIITTGGDAASYGKESRFGWEVEEYMNNLNSCIVKLGGNLMQPSFIYHDCVHYDHGRLQQFIQTLLTYFQKI